MSVRRRGNSARPSWAIATLFGVAVMVASALLDAVALAAGGMNADREVIFIDQRGTYHAEPFLSCPQNDEFLTRALSLYHVARETGKLDTAPRTVCAA